MRITFLCQYFPPEMGAPSARTFEHARRWVELGHDVTVVTGFPNHPTGIIRPEYRGQFVKREQVEGIDLLRTWVYCAANKGFFRRVLNFFSFFFSSLILGVLMTSKPDVVIGTSPQFFCAVAAYLLSRVKRVPFIFEVRDIWPQSAIEMGVLKNRWLIRALETIEMHLYRHAVLIVPVAESTREYLLNKGIPSEKIKIITNGIDANYLASSSVAPEEVRQQLGLADKFVVSYIGTHGMAHALDIVLDVAKRFVSDSSVQFLFIGEGAEKANLKQLAERLALNQLWWGRFVDASGVWTSQGHGEARILGKERVALPNGPAFAVLASDDAPWPTATRRELGQRWLGYDLDAQQRADLSGAARTAAVDLWSWDTVARHVIEAAGL